ncbi:MAG: MotA/TolQ/ExbB proton channel family protein [Alphaproteobacteria bacterium]|nr:MotA/TolQ/ExbB proton channel family protein [Alphaproteobacteria bacterium]
MPTLLEQPWLKRRYVRHYLGHIAQTGGTLSSALQQNAIENELRELSNEYEHKLELPQFISGFMIAMGLLGTFIGLLETLTGISGMLDGFGAKGANMEEQFMKLVVELKKPLAGMGIAFSASMFGLITSLTLAIMMINLRRYVSRVVSCARNVMHNLIQMVRSSAERDQISAADVAALARESRAHRYSPVSISEGDSSLQDIVYEIHDSNLNMISKMDVLSSKLATVLDAFEISNKSTQKLSDLLGFGPRMKETSEAMLEELKGVGAAQTEQKKFFQRMIDMTTEVTHSLNGMVDVQRESHISLGHQLKDLEQNVGEAGLRMLNGIVSADRELQSIFSTSLKDVLSQGALSTASVANNIVNTQRESNEALIGSLKEFGGKLSGVEQSNISLGKHLYEIKENFAKLSSVSGVGQDITKGIGQQTLLLETMVREDRNMQKRLASIQQDLRDLLTPSEKSQEQVQQENFPILPTFPSDGQ